MRRLAMGAAVAGSLAGLWFVAGPDADAPALRPSKHSAPSAEADVERPASESDGSADQLDNALVEPTAKPIAGSDPPEVQARRRQVDRLLRTAAQLEQRHAEAKEHGAPEATLESLTSHVARLRALAKREDRPRRPDDHD